jgi:hypothetical protein
MEAAVAAVMTDARFGGYVEILNRRFCCRLRSLAAIRLSKPTPARINTKISAFPTQCPVFSGVSRKKFKHQISIEWHLCLTHRFGKPAITEAVVVQFQHDAGGVYCCRFRDTFVCHTTFSTLDREMEHAKAHLDDTPFKCSHARASS